MTRAKTDITPLDDLFGGSLSSEKDIIQIPLAKLQEFPKHPFKVVENEDMQHLVESIKENGILEPITVIKNAEEGYYIISGHRRKYACEALGIDEIPARIRDVDFDKAVEIMVDSNIHREIILPSEKAWAYRMKLEAMSRQGKKTSRPVGERSDTAEQIGEEQGDSGRQVQRYMRLTYLNEELLQMVDDGKLKFRPAVELSYLSEEMQRILLAAIEECGVYPSLVQAARIKELAAAERFNEDVCYTILTEDTAKKQANIKINSDVVRKYVPETYTSKETEELIENLLLKWAEKNAVLQ